MTYTYLTLPFTSSMIAVPDSPYRLKLERKEKQMDQLKSNCSTEEIPNQTCLSGQRICEPCKFYEKTNLAEHYCKECEEYMCDSCMLQHISMKKLSMHHVIDINVISPPIKMCEPCEYNKIKTKASHMCEECDEYLCGKCQTVHISQKMNRNHHLRQLSSFISCEKCSITGVDVKATVYCKDCGSPICDTCADIHRSTNRTKGHILSTDLTTVVLRSDEDNCDTQTHIKDSKKKEFGKPYSTEKKSDRILLKWEAEQELTEQETYQIVFKEYPNGKWRPYISTERCNRPITTVSGLQANTSYTFKVKIIDDKTGMDGQFTIESDPITTRESPALGIMQSAELIDHGPPKIYRLPVEENKSARNEKAKTRKFSIGKEGADTIERTIMIVGATGSGKSTLINAIANYLLGVTWEDSFRFTLIHLEDCEKTRENDQALSQTEWVTCYTIHSNVSERLNYTVNLIDTPGFGDTRGLEQDAKIVDQIRELFISQGQQGVATLDAVCFILKAPDARLTATQAYIFESILSLFGNDIKDNICNLITFADGQKPQVLSGIQAIDGIPLPYDTYFTFNNSALFVDNTMNAQNNLSSFFWEMGIKSCKTFFSHISTLQTKSLCLTTEVLNMRLRLEDTVVHLQQEIDLGLSQINVMEKEVDIFTQNATAILENEAFEYEVEEDFQEKIDLSGKGQFTTNCLTCNSTCHENCAYANDNDKAQCMAMDSYGNCTKCPKECHWSQHHNTPYIFKWSKRKITKSYEAMKKKYEDATEKTLTQEQVLDQISQHISQQEEAIHVMIEVIKKLNNRLKEIALRPDPLSTVQYIDLMIASEKREKKSGFETRIDALENCKKRATYDKSVQIFKDRIHHNRQKMAASDVADEILKDDKTILSRLRRFFGLGKQ